MFAFKSAPFIRTSPGVALAAALALLSATACAPEESQGTSNALNGTSNTQIPSSSASVTAASGADSDLERQLNALFGTYTATLVRASDGVNVPVTLQVSRKTVSGVDYAFLVASCSGTACNGVEFSVSSYLSYVALGSSQLHGLTSGTVVIDGISEFNVAIELILAVSEQADGTYAVDSPQSSLFLKDCGFYESASGASCSNLSADASFTAGTFAKQ